MKVTSNAQQPSLEKLIQNKTAENQAALQNDSTKPDSRKTKQPTSPSQNQSVNTGISEPNKEALTSTNTEKTNKNAQQLMTNAQGPEQVKIKAYNQAEHAQNRIENQLEAQEQTQLIKAQILQDYTKSRQVQANIANQSVLELVQ